MAPSPKTRSSKAKKNRTRKSLKNSPRARHSPPVQVQHDTIATRIIGERYKAFLDRLLTGESGDGVQPLYEIMEESYNIFDSILSEITLDPPLACKRGCIYCCINQVSLTEPEALFLGFHLLETRTEDQLADLRQKTKTLLTELKGKSRQEIGMERHLHPCLFIENGTCSIYAARPLVCRGWNSINADMCRHSNQSGDAMAPIENQPLPRIVADSIQIGLLNAAKELRLETGYLLLPRAVHLVLEGGNDTVVELTENWLEGKPFFAKGITV